MRKNYDTKRIKIGKFYLWFYTERPFRINCWGIGEWSGSSFFRRFFSQTR